MKRALILIERLPNTFFGIRHDGRCREELTGTPTASTDSEF